MKKLIYNVSTNSEKSMRCVLSNIVFQSCNRFIFVSMYLIFINSFSNKSNIHIKMSTSFATIRYLKTTKVYLLKWVKKLEAAQFAPYFSIVVFFRYNRKMNRWWSFIGWFKVVVLTTIRYFIFYFVATQRYLISNLNIFD